MRFALIWPSGMTGRQTSSIKNRTFRWRDIDTASYTLRWRRQHRKFAPQSLVTWELVTTGQCHWHVTTAMAWTQTPDCFGEITRVSAKCFHDRQSPLDCSWNRTITCRVTCTEECEDFTKSVLRQRQSVLRQRQSVLRQRQSVLRQIKRGSASKTKYCKSRKQCST